jgi:hypothetical protein
MSLDFNGKMSAVTGAALDSSEFKPNSLTGAYAADSGTAITATYVNDQVLTAKIRSLSISLPGAKPMAGKAYALTAGAPEGATVIYVESDANAAGGGSARSWFATAGSLTFTSVAPGKLALTIADAAMSAAPTGTGGSSAVGTFTLNVTGMVSNVTGL